MAGEDAKRMWRNEVDLREVIMEWFPALAQRTPEQPAPVCGCRAAGVSSACCDIQPFADWEPAPKQEQKP